MNRSKVIVILGPTASGKSDLAVALARKFNGEVISADSRQVYKGLDIGTGKITKKEMKGVRHHLLDVVSPQKTFTVSDYVKLTICPIGQIVKSGKLPIICGGTGFYIDTLLGEKQIPEVPPNPELRKKLEKKSTEALFKILQKLDPERVKNIDAKNPRRLVRAIEICKALGSVPKLVTSKEQSVARKYDVLKIGIKVEKEELKNRINKRIKKWFKMGLLKEVKKLHRKGLSWKRMSEIGLEYKLLAQYYTTPKKPRGTLDIQTEMARKTYQYAKRQMTWFKRDQNIKWFTQSNVEGLSPKISLIEKEVRKFL